MTNVKNNDKGWRGSPEIWFEAAIEILLESGVEAVKIATLAKRLGLSRTSFYWFFEDRDALLKALLDAWEAKNTGSIVKQASAYADTLAEATLNLFDCWIDSELFDAKLEFAIRSWSLQSKDLQTTLQEADQTRLKAIGTMFRKFGFNSTQADVHARTIYLVQIGYISMQTKESLAERMARIPEYVKTFTGVYPENRELERFYHRHNYRPEK